MAWSKRKVFPVMTEEAKKTFPDFYISLRSEGYEEEDGMERDKAEDIIEAMKRDGILYSPGSGVIKFL